MAGSLTPEVINRVRIWLNIASYDLTTYLDRRTGDGQPDEAARVDNGLLIHAAAVYGAARMASFIAPRKCKRAAATLFVVRDVLKEVADYLNGGGRNPDKARGLNEKLAQVEADLYLMLADCANIKPAQINV
jgi:hypothetical protein